MTTHFYIVSRPRSSRVINLALLDSKLSSITNTIINTHMFREHLITTLSSDSVDDCKKLINSEQSISYQQTFQTVDESHDFIKSIVREQDLVKHRRLLSQ